MVKMTKLTPSMAIRAHLRAVTPGFSLVLVLSAFSPSAAEPLLVAEYDGAPTSAAVIPRDDVQPPQGGEPSVSDFGSKPDAPAAVAIDAELSDAWAEAFAAGSRVPYRPFGPAARIAPPAYPVEVNSQVQYFLDLFTGKRRELITLWVNRSGQYLGMIREVLRSRGLPEDLAYTAMIESGFKPDAVSRAGAKGMWQFMAGTARRYGLRVDSWVDERYDPEKSTVAAAAYLRDLYNQFGSWSLAQAAYNAGEMKVIRAMKKTGSSDFWTLADSKHLKRETKDFVPQIHAATVIGRDPDRYGFEFEDVEPTAVELVKVPGGTDLRRLAASSSVPFPVLRSLNRVLVRGITPPGRPWQLRVPAGTSDSVLTALAPRRRTPAPAVATGSKPAPAVAVVNTTVSRAAGRGDVHVVRPRDTVSSIAKRYGVSVGDVMRWNSLEQQARIRPGDRLRVATRPSVEPDGQGGFR
jgi:membrane-bound lytic murein transglycosylase D